MANHKKFLDPTVTNIFWSKRDLLYLDSIRGKMSRGEYLANTLHISKKDQEFIQANSAQISLLKSENDHLRKQLQECRAENSIDRQKHETKLEETRMAYLLKNKENIQRNRTRIDNLNWKKIAADNEFKSVLEARKWFEAHIENDIQQNAQSERGISSLEALHPGCLTKKLKNKMSEVSL